MRIKLSEFLKTHKVSELYMKEVSFDKCLLGSIYKTKAEFNEYDKEIFKDCKESDATLHKCLDFYENDQKGVVIGKTHRVFGVYFPSSGSNTWLNASVFDEYEPATLAVVKRIYCLRVSVSFEREVLVPFFACWVDVDE